jgi:hypothetical protein
MPLEGDVDLTIRHAQPGDAAALAQLMCELGYETTTAEMSQRLKSILSDPRYRTIVAEFDDKLCGMIGTLTHVSHEHNDRSGKVIALVVSKQTATKRCRPRAYYRSREGFREKRCYASDFNDALRTRRSTSIL